MNYVLLLLLQRLVRGGIEVSARIKYYLRPEMCFDASSGVFRGCLSVYHAFPPNRYLLLASNKNY